LQTVAAIGLRFSDAAEAACDGHTEALAARTHRWAIAERVAWGEIGLDLASEAMEVHAQLGALLSDPPTGRQVVHGDLTENVYVDPSGMPVASDLSPYLRPREWAVAIVVADAVLWNGAEPSLAVRSDRVRARSPRRALIFRMVAEQLATEPRHGAHLEPYRRVLSVLSGGARSGGA
jgi:hypothetical protein